MITFGSIAFANGASLVMFFAYLSWILNYCLLLLIGFSQVMMEKFARKEGIIDPSHEDEQPEEHRVDIPEITQQQDEIKPKSIEKVDYEEVSEPQHEHKVNIPKDDELMIDEYHYFEEKHQLENEEIVALFENFPCGSLCCGIPFLQEIIEVTTERIILIRNFFFCEAMCPWKPCLTCQMFQCEWTEEMWLKHQTSVSVEPYCCTRTYINCPCFWNHLVTVQGKGEPSYLSKMYISIPAEESHLLQHIIQMANQIKQE